MQICVYLCVRLCMTESERPYFSGPFGQRAKKNELKKKRERNPQRDLNAWAVFEKAACTSFAQISPNPSHLNLSPPQSAGQQINTIRKDNSAGPGLTVISQISERPREDTSPKPRLSPQI